MKALIVYWHPEPQSFNHAMFYAAKTALGNAGWEVETSDLHAMAFNPVSGRSNFQSESLPPDSRRRASQDAFPRGAWERGGPARAAGT